MGFTLGKKGDKFVFKETPQIHGLTSALRYQFSENLLRWGEIFCHDFFFVSVKIFDSWLGRFFRTNRRHVKPRTRLTPGAGDDFLTLAGKQPINKNFRRVGMW